MNQTMNWDQRETKDENNANDSMKRNDKFMNVGRAATFWKYCKSCIWKKMRRWRRSCRLWRDLRELFVQEPRERIELIAE